MGYIDVADTAATILAMYQLLIPKKTYSQLLTASNDLAERLTLLHALRERKVSLRSMSEIQRRVFAQTLRDAACLRDISGAETSPFAPFIIQDVMAFGPGGERAGYAKSSSQMQSDWTFQAHVQAALTRSGYKNIRDLKHEGIITGRVCDFAVPLRSDAVELLECKRVHPHSNALSGTADAIAKITDSTWLDRICEQFKSTESALISDVVCNHLLVDISAYSTESRIESLSGQDIEIVGFAYKDIEKVKDALAAKTSSTIDHITVCWTNSLLVNGCFTAMTQSTSFMPLSTSRLANFRYPGWTVEGYSKDGIEYTEFRVSDTVGSLSRIIATYNNLISPTTFYTVGEPIKLT